MIPSRVLICRTDNIGDVVLTLPLAAYLKQCYPDAKVDFLVRTYAAPVVRQCRFVDEVLTIEEHDSVQRMFAERHYDTVIFAFPDRTLAQAARRARVPQRVGTSHRLYHWTTCNRLAHFSRVKSNLHEAQLNFLLLQPLGIGYVPPLAEIPALYGLQAPQLPEVQALRAQASFNLILHPKSNGNGREWPLAHYLELARRVQGIEGVAVWITGSTAEGELMAREAPALLALPHVRNLCGRFDLHGLVGLIGAASGLVASGTGPLHIAAAVGIPVLGLFPPIKPIHQERWGALGAQAQSITAPPTCTSCSGPSACRCMAALSVDTVAAIVKGWRAISRLDAASTINAKSMA